MNIENKEKLVNSVYNLLYSYEQIGKEGSEITLDSYLLYVKKLYVRFIGYGNPDIYLALKGLYDLRERADHETVKQIVFDIINILQKGG